MSKKVQKADSSVNSHGNMSPKPEMSAIVDWLDPKPITYSDGDQARISFEAGYLQNPNSQTE